MGGDGIVPVIGAASILAKVARDHSLEGAARSLGHILEGART